MAKLAIPIFSSFFHFRVITHISMLGGVICEKAGEKNQAISNYFCMYIHVYYSRARHVSGMVL